MFYVEHSLSEAEMSVIVCVESRQVKSGPFDPLEMGCGMFHVEQCRLSDVGWLGLAGYWTWNPCIVTNGGAVGINIG